MIQGRKNLELANNQWAKKEIAEDKSCYRSIIAIKDCLPFVSTHLPIVHTSYTRLAKLWNLRYDLNDLIILRVRVTAIKLFLAEIKLTTLFSSRLVNILIIIYRWEVFRVQIFLEIARNSSRQARIGLFRGTDKICS